MKKTLLTLLMLLAFWCMKGVYASSQPPLFITVPEGVNVVENISFTLPHKGAYEEIDRIELLQGNRVVYVANEILNDVRRDTQIVPKLIRVDHMNNETEYNDVTVRMYHNGKVIRTADNVVVVSTQKPCFVQSYSKENRCYSSLLGGNGNLAVDVDRTGKQLEAKVIGLNIDHPENVHISLERQVDEYKTAPAGIVTVVVESSNTETKSCVLKLNIKLNPDVPKDDFEHLYLVDGVVGDSTIDLSSHRLGLMRNGSANVDVMTVLKVSGVTFSAEIPVVAPINRSGYEITLNANQGSSKLGLVKPTQRANGGWVLKVKGKMPSGIKTDAYGVYQGVWFEMSKPGSEVEFVSHAKVGSKQLIFLKTSLPAPVPYDPQKPVNTVTKGSVLSNLVAFQTDKGLVLLMKDGSRAEFKDVLSPDWDVFQRGKWIYLSSPGQGLYYLTGEKKFRQVGEPSQDARARHLMVSPDGSKVYYAKDNKLMTFDLESGTTSGFDFLEKIDAFTIDFSSGKVAIVGATKAQIMALGAGKPELTMPYKSNGAESVYLDGKESLFVVNKDADFLKLDEKGGTVLVGQGITSVIQEFEKRQIYFLKDTSDTKIRPLEKDVYRIENDTAVPVGKGPSQVTVISDGWRMAMPYRYDFVRIEYRYPKLMQLLMDPFVGEVQFADLSKNTVVSILPLMKKKTYGKCDTLIDNFICYAKDNQTVLIDPQTASVVEKFPPGVKVSIAAEKTYVMSQSGKCWLRTQDGKKVEVSNEIVAYGTQYSAAENALYYSYRGNGLSSQIKRWTLKGSTTSIFSEGKVLDGSGMKTSSVRDFSRIDNGLIIQDERRALWFVNQNGKGSLLGEGVQSVLIVRGN